MGNEQHLFHELGIAPESRAKVSALCLTNF